MWLLKGSYICFVRLAHRTQKMCRSDKNNGQGEYIVSPFCLHTHAHARTHGLTLEIAHAGYRSHAPCILKVCVCVVGGHAHVCTCGDYTHAHTLHKMSFMTYFSCVLQNNCMLAVHSYMLLHLFKKKKLILTCLKKNWSKLLMHTLSLLCEPCKVKGLVMIDYALAQINLLELNAMKRKFALNSYHTMLCVWWVHHVGWYQIGHISLTWRGKTAQLFPT